MDAAPEALPDDVEALKSALLAARAQTAVVAAELAVAKARASEDLALIAHQNLRIAKLERQIYGPRAERSARLIEQMELQLEDTQTAATEDEIAAEQAVAKTTTVAGFTRKRPAERSTFPEHLPRERLVIAAPTSCACCGGVRLRKLGEHVTRTLEVVPRQWKVIETVREKFTCRDCEKISQAPAPFHVIPRGWAGPSLLAMILFEKFGQHQPLNRQVERYALEGVPISLSTVADAVGAGCAVLEPLLRLVEAHVMAAERLHGDDTTVQVQALGKCNIGRCWVYVRDDRPFGGRDPPAAIFYYSRDRAGAHPQAHLARYGGILQADAFGGYTKLYEPGRSPGPIQEAACWVHLWMPPLLQGPSEQWRHDKRLQSSIRPSRGEHPASPAVMVRSADRAQSRDTSSKLDAPSGLLRSRSRRSPSHAHCPSRRFSPQLAPAESLVYAAA
ncbi:MAG: IS66 family transposase [Caulobacteraceae bacterium]|nr:IS66 family transposase [Caulobacteraceae bacterium]